RPPLDRSRPAIEPRRFNRTEVEMEIRFPRPDGKEESGYLAMPQDGEHSPAIVLVHEWWGLNDQTRGLADRLAEEGFRVFVPDLYGGRCAKIGDVDKAKEL